MKWTGQRKLITGGFSAALGVLALIGGISFRTTSSLIRFIEERRHSFEIIQKLEILLSELKDAETGQRGYLLTGKENYLEPYEAALGKIGQTTNDLRDLTAGNPEHQISLRALEGLIAIKLSVLQQTIRLRQENQPEAALQIVLTDKGKNTMDEIRKITDEMQSREEELMKRLQRDITASARRATFALLFGTSLSFVLLLSVFFLLNREIIQRTSAEEGIRQLNEDLMRRRAELEAVNMELNTEITTRNRAEEKLKTQATVLQQQASLLDIAHDSIIVRDLDGLISFWNQGAEATYGWRRDQAVGQLSHTLLQTRLPQPLEQINATMLRDGLWEGELDHARSDGSRIIVLSCWVVQRDDQGRPVRVLESNNDITERKRAEEGIQRLNVHLGRRTEELEAANKELESFTYSVAHDLRAPLRHIDGFSKMLEEETDALPDEAKRFVNRIREGTRQMGQLVDDLLNLARLGRKDLSLQVAGLRTLAVETADELKKENAARSIEWKIGPLPFVECDPALMKQVFVNLLSNAAKYTRPRQQARIEVGVLEEHGQPVIFVRDNGVGFSMKYADKLFGVFQRLHRAEDFEGTGIGLATVQRILHKHGGRIWAEAELDKGATFYFTLGAMEGGERNEKVKAESRAA